MPTQIGARMSFDNARTLAMSLGYNLDHARCTQSYIRSEVALSTTQATYHIPVLVNDTQNGSVRALENRLNLQDLFFVTELFIGWTSATATATNGQVYTYPNTTVSGCTYAGMNTFYNGKLQLSINNETILPSWDINRHWVVNQTQQNTNFNAATATSPAVFNADQLNLSQDGFYPVEPGFILNGASNINAQIQLAGAPSAIPSNGAIVCLWRGLLLQNTTTIK
jgi:hypothetical protein